MNKKVNYVIILVLSATVNLYAQLEPVEIGSQAPPITIQQWLKGTPIMEFVKGKVYVVEFVSTGCPACVKVIPHLSELSEMFKGKIEIISIYVRRGDDERRFLRGVTDIMDSMGSKIKYSVALDTNDQSTKNAWRIAGFPYAFIIEQNGKVAWKGLPSDLDQCILEKVVSGTLDGQALYEKQREVSLLVAHLINEKQYQDYAGTLNEIDSLIYAYPNDVGLYYAKFKILAQNDSKIANDLIRWLYKSHLNNFVPWTSFISNVVTMPKQPDFNLAAEIMMQEILKANTKSELLGAWDLYIIVHIDKYLYTERNFLPNRIKDLVQVTEACTNAIADCLNKGIREEDIIKFRNIKFQYEYKTLIAKGNKNRANKLVKKHLDVGSKNISWYELLSNMSNLSIRPKCSLVLRVTDMVIQEDNIVPHKISALQTKINIYLARKNQEKAHDAYRQLLALCKTTGRENLLAKYERLFTDIISKQ